ncbi:MAG: ribonuclease Y [Chloroflexi bacterium]|jgi:ribonuclease Y|nr:MAG: phosphodiesterase [Chloroflexi bacterium OLB13]MBV6437258.1 Ribonuclease Y [Anaerolineae bacterium]MCC6565309.1 ribonuclease Y [Chloroflexota bacterium]MDL1917455.1 ribonuclease Y [Anaerolineae bacterium CFX4]OQY79980.1 MAG: ribonuclease Y [Anaerolineae bacterium UTCFX5]
MEPILAIALIIAAAVAGAVGGVYYYSRQQRAAGTAVIQLAQAEAEKTRLEAKAQAEAILKDSEHRSKSLLDETETTINRRRRDLDAEEERLARRRSDLDQRLERLEKQDQNLNKRQSNLDRRENELKKVEQEKIEALQRISEMTLDEARQQVLARAEQDARNDMARIIRQVEAEAKVEADTRARDVISLAVQRLASEHISETAVSVVPLPGDDMKGRIIGRAGRNIRAFEMLAGVDVVVDDTPEAVTISSFDPIRREVARRALSKLVVDGRIHPARIEKLLEDARNEVDLIIREEGERAAYEAGVPGLHPEIIKLLGRLKFRFSYGQNMHGHSIETSHIAGMIAAELGANVEIAKAGGLLHDLGKAIDHEVEGTHAMIGAEFCKRYGVNAKVVNCIASHHHEVEQECVEAYIVEAADAISGARPGARRENVDSYIKRVKTLEDIAKSFPGVDTSYALQAGREVRILVKPEQVDELGAVQLARDIAKQIEDTMQYPGMIKVHVIRESRHVEYAK